MEGGTREEDTEQVEERENLPRGDAYSRLDRHGCSGDLRFGCSNIRKRGFFVQSLKGLRRTVLGQSVRRFCLTGPEATTPPARVAADGIRSTRPSRRCYQGLVSVDVVMYRDGRKLRTEDDAV